MKERFEKVGSAIILAASLTSACGEENKMEETVSREAERFESCTRRGSRFDTHFQEWITNGKSGERNNTAAECIQPISTQIERVLEDCLNGFISPPDEPEKVSQCYTCVQAWEGSPADVRATCNIPTTYETWVLED